MPQASCGQMGRIGQIDHPPLFGMDSRAFELYPACTRWRIGHAGGVFLQEIIEMSNRVFAMGVFALGTFMIAGCGPSTVGIEGKVTNGTKAYSPSTDGDLNVGLTAEAGGKNYSGKVDEEGNFRIAGVPAGQYRVSLTRYPKVDEKAKSAPTENTKKLDEKWDVSSSNNTFTIDASKIRW
jgi:hypothetical protein